MGASVFACAAAASAEQKIAMSTDPVTNSDVFLWAIYELGGADEFVDVEDVFYRAFELAPLRLSWRTRPNVPDLKKCSKALRDAEGRTPRLLVKQGSERRRLTVEGQRWIEENFDRLANALGGEARVRAPQSRAASRLVAQALQSKVFGEWKSEAVVTAERWRIAELLRCLPDSSRSVFRNRIEELRAAAYASGRTDALEFFDAITDARPDWF